MNIDFLELSTEIVTILAPFTPLLIHTANFSAEAIGEMVVQTGGQMAWQKAQAIWDRIQTRYGDDGAVNGAAMMVAAEPENKTFQKVWTDTLVSRLQQNPDLARELRDLLGHQEQILRAKNRSRIEKVVQETNKPGSKQTIEAIDNSSVTDAEQRII